MPPDLASQATKSALEGNWEKAVELNFVILSKDGDNIDALNRLAHAFCILGKIKEAKKTYQQVLILDPYNHIAQKNLKKISTAQGNYSKSGCPSIPCLFLEEPGKTKVTSIVNPAPQKVLSCLSPGASVELSVKKHTVLILKDNEYLGALPDDLAHRLIHLTRLGNTYQAFVKAVDQNSLHIFLQEEKRGKRVGNQPSFPLGKNDGFYPFVYSKQALDIDKEPPEGSLEDDDGVKETDGQEEI